MWIWILFENSINPPTISLGSGTTHPTARGRVKGSCPHPRAGLYPCINDHCDTASCAASLPPRALPYRSSHLPVTAARHHGPPPLFSLHIPSYNTTRALPNPQPRSSLITHYVFIYLFHNKLRCTWALLYQQTRIYSPKNKTCAWGRAATF